MKNFSELASQLRHVQNEDGSFSDSQGNPSLLHSGLMLIGLNNFSQKENLGEIREKLANYLLSKRGENWQFSPCLWLNFLVLYALIKYKAELIDGKAIANILLLLGQLEAQEGGPYYSFLANNNGDASEEKEVDLDANVMINSFLAVYGVRLPNLTNLIEQAIKNKNLSSSMISPAFMGYLISLEHSSENKEKLKETLEQSLGGANFFDQLLIINALANLGYEFSEEETEKISEKSLLYKDGKQEIFTTSALDMTFCSLANQKNNRKEKSEIENEKEYQKEKEELMIANIFGLAEKRFMNLEGELKSYALGEIKKTISGNPDKQMSLMAYFMREALGKQGKKFSDETIAKLGLANIFFWTAFIIYDNFWDEDEEAGARILPTANLYAREFVSTFSTILPEEPKFREFFQELMDKLDAANTWETIYCRMKIEDNILSIPSTIPDYGNFEKKYYPAAAHILGPVVMLCQLGYASHLEEVKNLTSYFQNYLIPKQINDDLHDWKEDLRRGHISTVIAMLLSDFGTERKTIDLEKDLDELQQVFWFKTLPKAAKLALEFVAKSKEALEKMESIENKQPLEQYILHEEQVLRQALAEQKNTVELLNTFK